MARYIQRPENALKRANEFIDVGKPARALDTLQEVFRNKKWTYTWSESVIEPIMFKYLDLCVELKKSHIAKEGLFQYRNIFQLVNVGSLENVIRGYLRMAEERTEAAQQQSSQAILDIDDLDNLTTPENILMSAVCGEDAQDRSDRTILLPWVKFLWESYCQCLELLRVNSHCETLYHDIARMAFQFCLKYNRKMEFRKLCDKLRKHLEDISKVSTQSANVSISKPETQQLNLDTRLHQLDSAIQMELWQEAYKAIEDIHGLMALSKKTPVPKTMAQYYQKLAMVFWKAGNQLFHAAALLKLFQLSRDMKKNVTAEELQKMASHVLVATLAIPLPSAHPEFDRFIETDKSPLEKAQRLAVLLALSQPPSRASLLKDLMRLNVIQLAAPQFQNLHKWLEVDFHPLSLCNLVQSIIDEIKTDENNPLIQYIQALQDVTLVRLVRQVSQVYQSIEFTRFLELAKFATSFYLERILVDCVRHNDMQITIDHKLKCIHFGTDLSESQRQDHPDGPTLQSMPSEQIRSQLVNMSVVLHRAIATINPNRKKAEREKMRNQMVQIYHDTKVKEHQRILQRQKIIEDRKEYIERMNTEREEEELRRQEEEQRKLKLAEAQRLQQEMEERERKRHANELQQIKDRNLKEKMQQISQTRHGQKVLQKLDEEEIKKLDAEQIAAREAEELLRERKELQSKLKSQEKKIDYFERAKRIEEIPLIEQFLAEKQVQDKEFWEKQEQLRIETAIAERKNAVLQQDRLKRMQPDREIFWEKLRDERNSMYVEKLKKFNVYLEEERKKRLAQRVIERREERRQEWLREKEEEQRRIEDEIRREKEELERIEKEKRDKEREIEAEKLRLINEKRLAREEEIERKLEEEREQNRVAMREKEQWRNEEPGKQQDSDWRARAPAAAVSNDATPKNEAWRSTKYRDGEGRKDDRPMRRDDRGEFRRSDKDTPIRRGGDDRDAPVRRGGDDRDTPMRRGGDDRDAPIRRGGDDRDAPIRRGGDDRDSNNRRGGDDRDAPMRRGGDDRDGPIRRGGNDRDGPMRRGGDDRDAPMRRGGDDRDAPMRRGGDDRNNEFRRGGDDRFGRRDARKTDSNDSWRRGPPKDDDKSRRPGAPSDRDRNRGQSNRGDDNWRSAAGAEAEEDPKDRPKADKAARGGVAGSDNADSGWTDVKRR